MLPALVILVAAVFLEKLVPSIQPELLKIDEGVWQRYVIASLYQQQMINAPNVQSLEQAFEQNYGATTAAIRSLHVSQRTTRLPSSSAPNLDYAMDKGSLVFSTNAIYGYQPPVCASKPGTKLDFKIAAAVNFGLRGFIVNDESCDEWQVGDYNTAYFAVAVSEDQRLLAFSVRGHYRIELYSLPDRRKLYDINGYAASSLTFWKGDLYFAAARKGQGDVASMFRYSLNERRVNAIFFRDQLADARGIAFRDESLGVVSDGLSSRLIAFNPSQQFAIIHIWKGFSYPNGVSFDAAGHLLVADEHHNLIRKISMQDFSELWHSPPGQLTSPGSVIEISKGRYKGHYLIADADSNRLLLVEPKGWEVVFEAGNMPSVMGAAAIFEE